MTLAAQMAEMSHKRVRDGILYKAKNSTYNFVATEFLKEKEETPSREQGVFKTECHDYGNAKTVPRVMSFDSFSKRLAMPSTPTF